MIASYDQGEDGRFFLSCIISGTKRQNEADYQYTSQMMPQPDKNTRIGRILLVKLA
jgi:hypothetical protein